MDAIFALTAAHIASGDKVPPTWLLQEALRYHTTAVAALQDAVETPDLEAAFIASILTMATAVVLPLLRGESAMHCLLHIHNFLKGVWTIIDLNPERFCQSPCRSMLGQTASQECTASEDDIFALRRLRKLKNAWAADNQTYDPIIDELELGFTFNKKRAISWVGKVGQDFIDSVSGGEPLAQLIFLHWAVHLCRLDEMWWAQYAGQKLVEELTKVNLRIQKELWIDVVSRARIQAAK